MNKLIKVLAVLMCFSFGSAKAVEIVSFNAASSEAYVGAFLYQRGSRNDVRVLSGHSRRDAVHFGGL